MERRQKKEQKQFKICLVWFWIINCGPKTKMTDNAAVQPTFSTKLNNAAENKIKTHNYQNAKNSVKVSPYFRFNPPKRF